MRARDDAAMGKLADSLIWPAIDLVGLVRGGKGDREAIGDLLSGLTEDERWALPVILAAMVDDTKTPDELLGWIDFDQHGRHLDEPRIVGPRWRTQVQCGTPAMFHRHLASGEAPCDECEAAEAKVVNRGIERKRQSRQAAKQEAA